jgi:hypothetical protein
MLAAARSPAPFVVLLAVLVVAGVLLAQDPDFAATLEDEVRAVGDAIAGGLSAAEAAIFRAQLPSYAQPFADVILQVAAETGVAASIIFGIGERETKWGTSRACRPKGNACTGDFIKRSALRWGSELPPDGLGWGRGLMQVDYGSQKSWLASHDWTDPLTNVRKGVEILLGKRDYLAAHTELEGDELMRAAVAAYNTGEGNVAKSVANGLDPDSTTAEGNYSRDVFSVAAQLAARFLGAGGSSEV